MQLELEHATDSAKLVAAKADAQGALLVAIAGDTPTSTTVQPTEPLGFTLNTGVSTSWDNMTSLTVVNDDTSTDPITITSAGFSTYIVPGEAVGWDAPNGAVLTVVSINVPATTTGRMFGTRTYQEEV